MKKGADQRRYCSRLLGKGPRPGDLPRKGRGNTGEEQAKRGCSKEKAIKLTRVSKKREDYPRDLTIWAKGKRWGLIAETRPPWGKGCPARGGPLPFLSARDFGAPRNVKKEAIGGISPFIFS